MGRSSSGKKGRHERLCEKIVSNPFLTDEELSDFLGVSIPTIRLDRLELGIPELRERVKNMAEKSHEKVKSLGKNEIVGEVVDLLLGKNGISILDTSIEMTFERTKIIRGQFIYSFAESLAMAVIDADVALVGVANIKYKVPVNAGAKLVAKAEVRNKRGNSSFVWVKIYEKQAEVFRGKFILVSLDE